LGMRVNREFTLANPAKCAPQFSMYLMYSGKFWNSSHVGRNTIILGDVILS
jgi:hypothetical protein